MIKGIMSGPGLQVSGGNSSPLYINMGAPSAGMIRYNNNGLEVYDGSSWMKFPDSYAQIDLDGDTQAVLAWARTKMAEEQRMRDLAARHPTVADALTAKQRAEEAVGIAVTLCDVK